MKKLFRLTASLEITAFFVADGDAEAEAASFRALGTEQKFYGVHDWKRQAQVCDPNSLSREQLEADVHGLDKVITVAAWLADVHSREQEQREALALAEFSRRQLRLPLGC